MLCSFIQKIDELVFFVFCLHVSPYFKEVDIFREIIKAENLEPQNFNIIMSDNTQA